MSNLKLIETYKSFLQQYSSEQLRHIPEQGVWSIGQMYDHLIVVAHEYLDSVEACASAVGEQKQGKTEFGEYLFNIGGFPPIKIKLPAELDTPPDNTKTKEDIILELDLLMKRMKELQITVDNSNPNYKDKHGGFGWLNAQEWFDLVGMHFRHHLSQKYELDQKLLV
ncbi:DinB family protein [Paenisporosarcina quisquiliarum]|uniref:DinB family protein n=1 Tax=Paenisporosarcina quisquiliarum TaxID=365346 RepID=A0A9X3LK02_9BACL|nr:DinB family protein [Paenisporosarcina quisquiliarum]MCZ8537924.1 DinB family protein [Paenisporosarcina quisquiliarum]